MGGADHRDCETPLSHVNMKIATWRGWPLLPSDWLLTATSLYNSGRRWRTLSPFGHYYGRACSRPSLVSVVASLLVITPLLTATLAAQGNQYPYHSERIPLTSVGTLGKSEDGKSLFPDQMTPGDLNRDGLQDVFLHIAVDSTSTSPEQPFLLLLNDGAGGLLGITGHGGGNAGPACPHSQWTSPRLGRNGTPVQWRSTFF